MNDRESMNSLEKGRLNMRTVSYQRASHSKKNSTTSWLTRTLILSALKESFQRMFSLSVLRESPTMAALFVVNVLLALCYIEDLFSNENRSLILFHGTLLVIMWSTSYFAIFSELIAIGRGKAHASSLRSLQKMTKAKRLRDPNDVTIFDLVGSDDLLIGDYVYVEKGEVIPSDGEVIQGAALIDESAVTGESAPVLREAGGDVSAVTGGTTVISDSLIMRVTQRSKDGFLSKMIDLVEGSHRRKTPNEEALGVLLTGCTILITVVVLSFKPLFQLRIDQFFSSDIELNVDVFFLGVLFVCLIPTTISGLLPAIGIAGMSRLIRFNVLALSSKAIEAAGDADILLLDKTGTITLGNRQAAYLYPADSVSQEALAKSAYLSSLYDDTPEGKSIIRLALEMYPDFNSLQTKGLFDEIPFSAKNRISGIVSLDGRVKILKGAPDAIEREFMRSCEGVVPTRKDSSLSKIPEDVRKKIEEISLQGGTPLLVLENSQIMGSIYLKDIVKPGLKERFSLLRSMGVKTIMVTGDNTLTAAAIAAESGVDQYYGESSPEDKLDIIRSLQSEGHMVAMAGDGSNDAPALAQADVAVAMNNGTQAARDAANLIDLDSNPTKLIEIIQIGKELLMTRGALTTFSIANDITKYFALLPACVSSLNPDLAKHLSIIAFSNPYNACIATALFNALAILFLIPMALKGVHHRPGTPHFSVFKKNLIIWGGLGIVSPFIGIKCIDLVLDALFL